MIRYLKSGLLRVLGDKNYLKLISTIFFISYKNGWLKNNPAYFTHYRVMELISPGNTILDIGANLGYYSVLFAKKVGQSGKVFSVEPIPIYQDVLRANTANFSQIEVLPYALGLEEGYLRMGNPTLEKHRHGLMHVLAETETAEVEYKVPVKNPATLFGLIEHIDYIKCDIEGYEVPVIPAMKALLEKHRPIIQVETQGENMRTLKTLFESLGYKTFYAALNGFNEYLSVNEPLPGDLIAIPKEKWNH